MEELQGRTEVREELGDLEVQVDGGGGAAPAGIEEVATGNAADATGAEESVEHTVGTAEQSEPPVFVTPSIIAPALYSPVSSTRPPPTGTGMGTLAMLIRQRGVVHSSLPSSAETIATPPDPQ